ncbi:MAG: bifunctional precorrin-2 dehydrogenase/sirohydrochlorin ferrochelatase [Thermoplasmata archaeon]
MIVDLNLIDKRVLLIGGERETERKVHMFLDAGAYVTLICPFFPESLRKPLEEGRLVYIEGAMEEEPSLLQKVPSPVDAIIVATEAESLLDIVKERSRRERALLYVVDDAASSDFIQPALRVVDTVQVAVSTGGKSPVMASRLSERFARLVTKTDLGLVDLHDCIRLEAMDTGIGAIQRRDLLRSLAEDPAILTLLEEGKLEEAKERARAALKRE